MIVVVRCLDCAMDICKMDLPIDGLPVWIEPMPEVKQLLDEHSKQHHAGGVIRNLVFQLDNQVN